MRGVLSVICTVLLNIILIKVTLWIITRKKERNKLIIKFKNKVFNKIIGLILLTFPIILNYLLIFLAKRFPNHLIGGIGDWISFLGSYFGIIGAIFLFLLQIKHQSQEKIKGIKEYIKYIKNRNIEKKFEFEENFLHNLAILGLKEKETFYYSFNDEIFQNNLLLIMELENKSKILDIYNEMKEIDKELEQAIQKKYFTYKMASTFSLKSIQNLKEISKGKKLYYLEVFETQLCNLCNIIPKEWDEVKFREFIIDDDKLVSKAYELWIENKYIRKLEVISLLYKDMYDKFSKNPLNRDEIIQLGKLGFEIFVIQDRIFKKIEKLNEMIRELDVN